MRTRTTQTIHIFNPPGLHHVQAVRGINVASEFNRHMHERFLIGIVEKGVRIIHQGGVSTAIPENALFVINPGTSHTCQSLRKEHSYFVICVEADSMKAIASQVNRKPPAIPYFKSTIIHNQELVFRLRRFRFLIQNTSSALERESVLASLLHTLVLQYAKEPPIPHQRGPHDDAIDRVCEFIRRQYSQDLSLKQLAKIACLSPFYFQRLFLTKTGVSPHDYLVHFRVKKALEFLSKGRNIAGVALETGFFDQSHFTRSFRGVMGMTPGDYLRTAAIGQSKTG
jgi:AraC-like DNA-binding protein